MVTGLRRAEVLALRWSDVDLAAGRLSPSVGRCEDAGNPLICTILPHSFLYQWNDPVPVEFMIPEGASAMT